MPENAFGLPGDTPTDQEMEAAFAEDEAPEEQEALETPGAEQTPEPEAPEAAPEAGPPAGPDTPRPQTEDTAPAPEPGQEGYLWAGRFTDERELERGYLEVRGLQDQTARERNAERARAEQAVTVARQVYAAYQEALQSRQQQPRPGQEAVPEGIDEDTLRALQPVIDSRVQQGMAQFSQQLQQQQSAAQTEAQAQAERQAAAQAIESFRTQHQGADEPAVSAAFRELDYASQNFDGTPLDVDQGNLEAAMEASSDPNLMRVLRLNPRLLESDEGMDYARQQATLLATAPSARPQSRGAGQGQALDSRASQVKAARVESGGAPPPAEGQEQPGDEWAEVLSLHKSERGKSSVFGV